jgi:Transposase DDE domain group 1
MTEATPFLPGLSPLRRKPLTAAQDAGNLSSNGGLIVLRESALRSGVAAVVADAVPDRRCQLLVTHSYRAMVTARMMAIAAGYEDADDLDALRFDPALMLACNREPEGGHGIASQPTISRLENVPDARTLYKIGIGYVDFFCRSYASPPHSIVLDIDDAHDLVHGGQQLALFNVHAGGYCFQPIHIFEGNSGKPILSLLRLGKRPSGEEVARVLWHVIRRIRRHWPKVRILVRGDSHYCAQQTLDLLRRLRCDYILGLAINPTLDQIAAPWREQCEKRRKFGRVRRFHQLTYQARRWTREEKVVARVEATEMGSDARFVVTNLTGRAKVLYEKVYCARGRMENMIKDLKLHTRSDKTACSRWQANQFRLFLHMGAYWLLHSVRLAAPKRSRWRGATFQTIRSTFVKLGCRVEELKSRIRLSFSTHLPHADAIAIVTARLCARGP